MAKITTLCNEFRLNLETLGRKPKYISLCMHRMRKLTDFLRKEYNITEIEDVTVAHIKAFIRQRQALGKEKNITINGLIATYRVFFQMLVDDEYIDEKSNPMIRVKNLKEDKRVIITFNDDEVKRIINDVPEATYSNIRDKLILIFLFDTGIRVSELCDIRNDDIKGDHILIRGKGSKERIVYISKIMRRYMRRYEVSRKERFRRREPDEIADNYFLDQSAEPLSRSRINKILKEHCDNVKVRKEVRCSPHDCRHYFAQKQLRNGVDIYTLSRLLGHYDTSMTAKYLRGIAQEDMLMIGRQFSPLRDMR